MSNAAGTIESVAIQLSKLLQPLESQLTTPAGAKALFAQMGFVLSDAQVAGVAAPLTTLAGNTTDLGKISAALVTAIEAEDYGALTAKGIEAIQRIVQVINALSTLGTQLSGAVGVPAGDVAKRIFDYLTFNYLGGAPQFNDALELLGLLDREERNEDSGDPAKPPFTFVNYRFDLIGAWFSNAGTQIRSLYGWGNGFDGSKLFSRIETIVARAGLPVLYDPAPVPKLDLVLVEAVAKTDVNPHGLLLTLKNDISPGTQTIPAGDDARVELKVDFQIPKGMALSLLPSGAVSFVPPAPGGTYKGDLSAKLIAQRAVPPEPFILFGQAGASRLELAQFTLATGTSVAWDGSHANGTFMLEGEAKDLKVVIDTTKGDGFLAKLLPGTHIEADFTTRIGVSTQSGFYFSGSGALEVQLPVHIDLGPVALERLTLAAKLDGAGKIPTSVGVNLRANLGPLMAVVENIGVTATFSFPPQNKGNLGPLNLDIGFKPPNGVGLSLDVGVVKGGGYLFFDFDRQEYAGVLELSLAGIVTVKAIGLITTKMPDGSRGFSLLLIITAEFGTGIQLGFGFTLLGVGGLVGLNRTMNLPPLVEGVRTGAVNSIMFPENPVANAPRIISDLRIIFPPYEGRFLIGPMAKLGWGTPTLVSVSLGVIIEITGNIAICGVLKVALPAPEAPLIIIQAAFVGAIEFDKQRLYFFAGLFESRIVFLTLEGEIGLLVAWGPDANFVLSAGGFHPRFNPPPMPFPSPKRIAVSLLNTDFARIRTETYFAVTSNTVQFGSNTEVMFDVDVARVEGHLSFDALFQFSPFYFIIEISASVSLKVFGAGLFSIHLEFTLSGPTPYRAKGSGSLSLFFFDVSADFDISWGDTKDTTLPPVEVMPLLQTEFSKAECWKAELPPQNNLLVSLRKLPSDESAQVLHPLGALRVSQRAVPLGLKIDKVGNQKPSDANQYKLTPTGGLVQAGDAPEQFAKAQFLNMSDADKLSQRAFDPMSGGLILASGAQSLGATKATMRRVRYEQIIIDSNYLRFRRRFTLVARGIFEHLLKGGAVGKSSLSSHYKKQLNPFVDKVTMTTGGFTVAHVENNQPFGAQSKFESEALASQYMKEQVAAHPELHESLHVIPQYDAAA
ncbi:MAG: DUF6603 domain-containing protein [Gammaproteobacteria bacterium]